MGRQGRTVQVLPDSERVEAALCDAAQSRRFVDAKGFLTFSQFLEEFEPAAHLKARPIAPVAARVLVQAVASTLPRGPFGDFIQEPAFARAALELFFDLKAGALPPLGFKSAVQSFAASRRPRAQFLADLYEGYEKALQRHGAADREDLASAVRDLLKERGLPAAFAGVTHIEFRGLYDFQPLRRELLFNLAVACEKAQISLILELPAGGGEGADAAVDDLFRDFEKRAQELTHIEVVKTDFIREGRPLGALGPQLFGTATTLCSVEDGVLHIRSAANEREEYRLIARTVRDAVRAGTPPERIAIAYRDLADEAEAIEEALEDVGLRARVRRGLPLVSTGAGRVALDLPLLVDDGFPAETVARLLGSRYVPRLGTGHDDATAVARVLAEASVRDDRVGKEGRRGAFDVRLSALSERLMERKRDARANEVRTVRERCVELIQICSRIPEEAAASVLLERWWSAVQALGIIDATRVPEARTEESSIYGRSVAKMLARDQAAAESLRALVEQFDQSLKQTGAAAMRITRRTFQRWLNDAAADFNLSPRGARGGAVRILDLRELPARTFDLVCIGGATDGRLPGRIAPNSVFADEDKAAVNAHQRRDVFRRVSGERDARVPWRLAEDRILFLSGLTAAKQAVLVSWPRVHDGREQIVSPFVDELARRTSTKIRHEPLLPVPALSDVANEAQLRERIALEALSSPGMRVTPTEPGVRLLRTEFAGQQWFREAASLAAIEEERLRFFSNPGATAGPHSGRVQADDLEPVLQQIFSWDQTNPVAATTLERFGNCAFQGFLSAVLKLEEPEAPGEEQDKRGQGAFWHAVLEQLFPLLRDKKLLGKPVDDIPDDVIDQALETAAEKSERRDHTGHPTLWKLSRERARAMVRRILSAKTAGLPFDGHEPLHTELQFGDAKSEPGFKEVVIPAMAGEAPIYLKGKIDRLDRGPDSVAIIDYKSSISSKKRDALLVTEFQLPIYLYAAKQSGLANTARAAWLSMKDGNAKHLEDWVDGAQGLNELIDTNPTVRQNAKTLGTPNLANAVHDLVAGLRAGHFPARAQDCGFCSFKAACRISDRQVKSDEETSG